MCNIYTTRYYLAFEEGNSATGNNRDGPCGHYAKWNIQIEKYKCCVSHVWHLKTNS